MRRFMVGAVLSAMVLGAAGCGGGGDGDGPDAGGDGRAGDERTVLVDFHHDEFTSAFLQYYPAKVTVRQGDTVRFKQAWSGEPHSVTLGKVVDSVFALPPEIYEYDGPEEAIAGGVAPEVVQSALDAFGGLPGMTGDGYEIFQAGAQPCFVPAGTEVPPFSDIETETIIPDATCPTAGEEQFDFTGEEPLYNSGFIPPTGESANTFVLPIAKDATPGTYQYFCNYHWTGMSGTVEVVAAGEEIPSQEEVNRVARREVEADAKAALQAVRAGDKGDFGDLEPPLAGRAPAGDEDDEDDEHYVIVNQFLPSKVQAKVGRPVTWTFDGAVHTVSFNVPKYFPIFTVDDDGTVVWEPKSYEPVGFDLPQEEPNHFEEAPEPVHLDAGRWDGSRGFRSSGARNPGDTFTITFTKAGTYPFACVLHPQMVGTLEVRS